MYNIFSKMLLNLLLLDAFISTKQLLNEFSVTFKDCYAHLIKLLIMRDSASSARSQRRIRGRFV